MGSDCTTGKMHVQVAIHRFPTLKYGCIHRASPAVTSSARARVEINEQRKPLRDRHFRQAVARVPTLTDASIVQSQVLTVPLLTALRNLRCWRPLQAP